MADPTSFVDDKNWHGGYYELSMRLGERADPGADQRLRQALIAVWADSKLQGCYLDRWTDVSGQNAGPPNAEPMDHPAPLYGLAKLPAGQQVVCCSHVVRFEGDVGQVGEDWLDLCLPLGSLGRTDGRVGAYPFERELESRVWREPIDGWFNAIASRVHREAGLTLGIAGFEVSGEDEAFTGGRSKFAGVSYFAPGGDDGELRYLKPQPWDP